MREPSVECDVELRTAGGIGKGDRRVPSGSGVGCDGQRRVSLDGESGIRGRARGDERRGESVDLIQPEGDLDMEENEAISE